MNETANRPTRPRYSLKGRLTALALAVVVGVWIAATATTWLEARHEAAAVFDAHLVQAASLLIAQTSFELEDEDEMEDSHAPEIHPYARQVAFQLWRDGHLQLHSLNAPPSQLSRIEEGFSDSTLDGERWRVFSSWNSKRRALVQVGERHAARDALAGEIAGSLLRPLLIALPLLAALIWWAVGRSVAPLARTAAEVARRSPTHLEPLPAEGLPAEALPLVVRLNALLARLGESLEHERRFTADAAHELRTPLAGLRAQAQVAAAAGDERTRQQALAALVAASDRMARLIEQLLDLARVDATASTPLPKINLVAVVQETLAELAAPALVRQVDLEMDAPSALTVSGNAHWLEILLRNLVDNALRFSAAGDRVTVCVRAVTTGAEIEVADQGPGVPPEELSRLGERFHRFVDGVSEAHGCGLGLSIVRRIAALHGGTIRFAPGSDGRGLRATVEIAAGTVD